MNHGLDEGELWFVRSMIKQRFVFNCGDYYDEYWVEPSIMLLRFLINRSSNAHLSFNRKSIVLRGEPYIDDMTFFLAGLYTWLNDSRIFGEFKNGGIWRVYCGYDFLHTPDLTKFWEWVTYNFRKFYGEKCTLTYTEVYPEGMEVKEG